MKQAVPIVAIIALTLLIGVACAAPAPPSSATAAAIPPSSAPASATTATEPSSTTAAEPSPATTAAEPSSMIAATIAGCPLFPADNIWNTPIAQLPVDSHSAEYINSIGANVGLHPDFGSGTYDGGPIGIPFNLVPNGQSKVAVTFDYSGESDPGPYPIPTTNLKIEYSSDHHILIVEQGACKLYETWDSRLNPDGSWSAGSGAIFDLGSNTLRTDGRTSADAAGLPILPGLARYDDIAAGAITHALRFTADVTRNEHIWPARHDASDVTDPGVPPMGQRFRLKASFDISPFSHDTKIMLQALKTYGMILADNGSNWYISGAPDDRWNNDELVSELRSITGSNFEAVDESGLQVSPDSAQAVTDTKSATPSAARQNQQITYAIRIVGDSTTVTLDDPLPSGVTFITSSLSITPPTMPTPSYASSHVTWSGAPVAPTIVTLTFRVLLNTPTTRLISNIAQISHGSAPRTVSAAVIANPLQVFLPMMRR
jgi:uncharacterized repeat protein (TIGR01451 family)